MTKKDIIWYLKSSIKKGDIQFADPTDKEYLLDILKDGDLDEFFSQLAVCKLAENMGEWDRGFLADMEAEWEGIKED